MTYWVDKRPPTDGLPHWIRNQTDEQVLRLAGYGFTDERIAAHFGVSVRAVRYRLEEMRLRSDLHGRTSLVADYSYHLGALRALRTA